MKKSDGIKFVIYMVAIFFSGVITAQFGYLSYLLIFSGNIGYSFRMGTIGNNHIVDVISRQMPIGMIILFLVGLTITIVLIMSLKKTISKVKKID